MPDEQVPENERASMKFRGHETFFIRKGWLSKGMKAVKADPYVFMGVDGRNPIDELGLGSNMVKSLRYWLQATGLTEEPASGKRYQTLTPFGALVSENDPYFEEMGTLWAIHCNLARNKNMATSWYFFFNEFSMRSFTKDDFVNALSKYAKMNAKPGKEPSKRSLEDDFSCILGTYISRDKIQLSRVSPENNIDCPLGELEVVSIDCRASKTYRKRQASPSTLHPMIVLSAVVAFAEDGGIAAGGEVSLDRMLTAPLSPGRLFNLDSVCLLNALYALSNSGYLKVVRTAGLDVVRIQTEMAPLDCLEEYYRQIG